MDLNGSANIASSFFPDTSAQKEEEIMRRTAHSKIQTAAGSSLKDPDGLTSDGGGGGVHFSTIAVAVNNPEQRDFDNVGTASSAGGSCLSPTHLRSTGVFNRTGINHKANRAGQFSQVSSVARYTANKATVDNTSAMYLRSPPQEHRLKSDVKTLSFIKGQSPP